jgi:protein involved in temperature-dependent protein secretion
MVEEKVRPKEAPKILTKPLPQILDDIEASIKIADEAAKNARKSAEDARKAGEKAASDATKAANQAIADVKQTADNAMELAKLLSLAIREAVAAIENRLSGKP